MQHELAHPFPGLLQHWFVRHLAGYHQGWLEYSGSPAGEAPVSGQRNFTAIEQLQDQWPLRLAAPLKATALNSRLLPQVSLAILLFSPGELGDVNCAYQFLEAFLEDFANIWDAVLVNIVDKGFAVADTECCG